MKLYHATEPENKKSILKRGVVAKNDLRGGGHGGKGVWATEYPDPSFGDLIVEMDVPKAWITREDSDGYFIGHSIPPSRMAKVFLWDER